MKSKIEKPNQSWWFLVVTLGLGGVFYFLVWPQAPIVSKDTAGYQAVAQDIQKMQFGELRLRPPGYALLLLGTGSATQLHKSLFVVSLILYLASIAMLYRMLFRCGTAAWLARVFVILALLPMYVETAATALSEVLTCFLITLAVVQAVEGVVSGSAWRFAASGAALAYAGFTHPGFMLAFIPVVFGLTVLWWPLRWTRIRGCQTIKVMICFSLFALLGVVSLFLFNSLAYGFKGISPFGGIALCTKTAAFVERLPESYGEARMVMIEARDQELLTGKSHTAESYIWRARQPLKQVTGMDDTKLNALLKKMNVELIKSSPLLYLNEVGGSMAKFWMPRTTSFYHATWLRLFCAIVSGLMVLIWGGGLVLLCAFGLLMTRRRYLASISRSDGLSGASRFLASVSFQVIANLLICWTCLIVCAFGTGEVRYRAPVELLLLACAVHGVHLFMKILKPVEPKLPCIPGDEHS